MSFDLVLAALLWLLAALVGGLILLFAGFVLQAVWADAIRPRLIPSAEIDRVADDIIARYPDPEAEAFARYERAWHRSDGAEQTYWHRVRKAVGKRLARS